MMIRVPTVDDAHAISSVHIHSWQNAYKGIVPQDHLDNMDIERSAKKWEDGLKNNHPIQRLVIEHDNQIIGFSAYGASREDKANKNKNAEIYAIYLNPKYTGQGFGRALIKESIAKLREKKYSDCIIWALKDNHKAISFYQRAGFILNEGKHKVFEVAGVKLDESCFELKL